MMESQNKPEKKHQTPAAPWMKQKQQQQQQQCFTWMQTTRIAYKQRQQLCTKIPFKCQNIYADVNACQNFKRVKKKRINGGFVEM